MTGLPDSLKLQAPAVPSLFSEQALGFATLSVQSVRSVRSVDREPHTPDFLKIFSLKTFLRLKNFVRMVLLEFVNNEAVIMEILYRIFTWLILATVLLLVMPIFHRHRNHRRAVTRIGADRDHTARDILLADLLCCPHHDSSRCPGRTAADLPCPKSDDLALRDHRDNDLDEGALPHLAGLPFRI